MAAHKRDFGSFHVSNVQELITAPENEYIVPSIPFTLPTFTQYASSSLSFGKQARKKHFLLDDTCTFLNHGAFGASLKEGLETVTQWQKYIDQQPLRFFDREMLPHMVFITRRMAEFVACPAEDLILIPNVTTGINCIMRSLKLGNEDVVYHLSLEYGAVKTILSTICHDKGAAVHEEVIPLPVKDENQILQLVQNTLPKNCRLAVFDHIPSNTPFILPVRQLADICHKRGVQILIDGAHALGQLPLNITELGVDFYLSNCHKWFCGPKGTAFMYVNQQHQSIIKPLVISHGYKSGFNSQFIWTGLQDYSPFLALHTVLNFWKSIGFEHITLHNKQLADEAANLLQYAWKSFFLAPNTMTVSLLCVALPSDLYNKVDQLSYCHAEIIQNALFHNYNIEVPIKCIQGHLYVRISAHVYNDIEEYNKLSVAINELTTKNILSA